MQLKNVSPMLCVCDQLLPEDLHILSASGYTAIIINRPDGEADGQPNHTVIESVAQELGLRTCYLPISPKGIEDSDVQAFSETLAGFTPGKVVAFCRTGTRSIKLWALSQAAHQPVHTLLRTAQAAGYDLSDLRTRLAASTTNPSSATAYDVLVIGGGAGGIASAASLKRRRSSLRIGIVEPSDTHNYQPGWTLVGGGVFQLDQTRRPMSSVIPKGTEWIHAACAGFEPEQNQIVLDDGRKLTYRMLIVSPGLKLNWEAVEGLKESLGRNGVTSNYRGDLAPYTWQLISQLQEGRALFTQPPMPIKCAGAPQKAMYLACDRWRRRGSLENISVEFYNAGGVLFGVQDYVPALMGYVERYGIDLCFNETLVSVDGDTRTAVFSTTDESGDEVMRTVEFDMLHACPPQVSPDFIRTSPLAGDGGWIDVNQHTLQHTRYENVFGIGDGASTPNAKTAAAVRKQAPVAAHNVLRALDNKALNAFYDGYGSCPLTVERGKIVLAEFGYGGKLDPTFPKWLLNGTKPSRLAWYLKERLLPGIYFNQMLRGTETLAAPRLGPERTA